MFIRAVLSATAASLLWSAVAWPCSHPFGSGFPYLAAPLDGEVAVPVDALIEVQWPDPTFESPLEERLFLRRPDGTDVPIVVERVAAWGVSYGWTASLQLRPLDPLDPDAVYEVHALLPSNYSQPMQRIATFTTGTATDDVAPAVPTASVTVGEVHDCTYAGDFGCCGQIPIQRVTIDVVDADPLLTYTVYDGGGQPILAAATPPLEGMAHCGVWSPDFDVWPAATQGPFYIAAGDYEFTIRARDRSGNESAPGSFHVTADCAAPVPTESSESSSCAIGWGGRSGAARGGAAITLGITFLLIVRLRRRWRRGS